MRWRKWQMYDDLRDKVAIVTGVGRELGIGQAIARRFAREGVHLVLGDICRSLSEFPGYGMGDWEYLESVAIDIRSLGVRALAIKVDVSQSAEVGAMVKAAMREFGRIDILVNNAGTNPGRDYVIAAGEEAWDRTMAVNAKGIFLCCKAVIPHMLQADRGGRIINISSISGKVGGETWGAYSASKAAAILLTQTLAIELGRQGITANAICPGEIDTLMQRKGYLVFLQQRFGLSEEEARERAADESALGRIGKADDIANVAAFLASDQASYITGQAINVCGGTIFH
jgi:NAD(P)-dependent dehydrogenase (short-subunit alcohol dehydrogenase family)